MNTYCRRLLTLEERVRSRIGPPDENGCRLWLGMRAASGEATENGYGYIKVAGVRRRVTRLLWELHHGAPVPDGVLVLHTCDNPPCCAIEHLWLGTNADNVADKVAKNRQATAHRKLSVQDARRVISLRERGKTLREIGDRYGVSEQAVWLIVTGRNFAYLQGGVQ